MAPTPKLKMTTDLPESIMAPDHVETSIGSLDYIRYYGPLNDFNDKTWVPNDVELVS